MQTRFVCVQTDSIATELLSSRPGLDGVFLRTDSVCTMDDSVSGRLVSVSQHSTSNSQRTAPISKATDRVFGQTRTNPRLTASNPVAKWSNSVKLKSIIRPARSGLDVADPRHYTEMRPIVGTGRAPHRTKGKSK